MATSRFQADGRAKLCKLRWDDSHLDLRRPSLPCFQQAAGLSTARFVFSSLLSSAVSQPFSPGDALEVIITIASGFISIQSRNNTEKWQTDGPGVIYYPVRESSFIMTTSSASSLCQHPFSLFFLPFSSLLRPPLYCR